MKKFRMRLTEFCSNHESNYKKSYCTEIVQKIVKHRKISGILVSRNENKRALNNKVRNRINKDPELIKKELFMAKI